MAISPTGTLAYLAGTAGLELADVSRDGALRRLRTDLRLYRYPRVSKDGKRVALLIETSIWVYDIAANTLTRLTPNIGAGVSGWTPDGRRIAWTQVNGDSSGIWLQPWDASAPPERVVPMGRGVTFTPDGSYLLTTVPESGQLELRAFPLNADSGRRPFDVFRATNARQLRLSPDGHWLVYVSEQAGTSEVFVQPFPGPGGRYQISSGGGAEPIWGPSGKELFYRGGPALIAASLSATKELSVIRRDTLFMMNAPAGDVQANYDVFPDGKHFIVPRVVSTDAAPIIVLGWLGEVRERMRVAAGK